MASPSIERVRNRNRKYAAELHDIKIWGDDDYDNAFDDNVDVFGDSETTKNVGSGIATGLSAATELVAKSQANKEAAAKAKENQKLVDAAQAKRTEAMHSAIEAQAEKDPFGPKHIAAQKLDVEARALEMKAGVLSPMAGGAQGQGQQSKPFVMPTWGWYVMGGVGVLGAGIIGYKLVTGSRSRYMPGRR